MAIFKMVAYQEALESPREFTSFAAGRRDSSDLGCATSLTCWKRDC